MSSEKFEKLQRETLMDVVLPETVPAVTRVKAARIRFAPDQPTGLHKHPVSTCGVVTAGTFRLQFEGEDARLLKTGDCFFEPAGKTVLHFDNASASEAAEIVCFYLTDSEDRGAIEMLPGGMDAQMGAQRG